MSVGNSSLYFQIFILQLIVIIQWDFCLHNECDTSQCSTQRSDLIIISLSGVTWRNRTNWDRLNPEELWRTTSPRCFRNTHIHIHIHIHIYTGAGHIIRISSKSWFISLIPFKKWNLYKCIHSFHTDWCISSVYFFNFDDYKWQLMKTPNSVSQKIRILLKTNTKKGFLEILANWKVWTWKVWACTALNT